MINFKTGTLDLQQELFNEHLPDGFAWESKSLPYTNMGKLTRAFAQSFLRCLGYIEKSSVEININETVDLISEWERSVGIPDDCFTGVTDLDTRRSYVIFKLTNYGGIQTAKDFENVVKLLGSEAKVEAADKNGVFPAVFPLQFFMDKKTADHTINVYQSQVKEIFALAFPLQFSSGINGVIECILRDVAPANTQLIFKYGV